MSADVPREPGYYWVRYPNDGDNWRIAEWEEDGYWFHMRGDEVSHDDGDFLEIGDRVRGR